jgi:hypothetical protein
VSYPVRKRIWNSSEFSNQEAVIETVESYLIRMQLRKQWEVIQSGSCYGTSGEMYLYNSGSCCETVVSYPLRKVLWKRTD